MEKDNKTHQVIGVYLPKAWIKVLRFRAMKLTLKKDRNVSISSLVRKAIAKTYHFS